MGPGHIAMVCREDDGGIIVKAESLESRYYLADHLVDQLNVGEAARQHLLEFLVQFFRGKTIGLSRI